MLTILYIFESIIFIYISWLAGHFLFNLLKINFSSKIKILIFPIIIGYGVIANIGLFLSLIGFYNRPSILLMIFGTILISKKIIYQHLKFIKNLDIEKIKNYFLIFFNEFKILKIIIAIWILFYFIFVIFPWTWSPDGLAYHIPMLMNIIETGKINFPIGNNSYYGQFPFLIELLYGTTIMLFSNFIVLKIIQFSALLSLLILTIDFAKKYIKNKVFIYLLIVLLLAHMPFVRPGIRGGMIDTFTHLYGLASAFLIFEYLLTKNKNKIEKRYIVTAGLLLGVSLASKYLGLLYAFTIFVVLLGYYIIKKYRFKIIVKNITLFLMSSFAMCGFWYLKNLILTGSPFHPFFTGDPYSEFAIEDLKIEKTFLNYFIFPFAYWGIDKIFKTQFALYNAMYFAGMYLASAYFLLTKKFSKLYLFLLIFIQIFLLLLFNWGHRPRFAIGVFAVTILLFVLQLDKIFAKITNKLKIKNATPFIAALILVASFVLFIFTIQVYTHYFACLKNKETQLACSAQHAGSSVYAVDYINNNLRNEKIASFFGIQYKYKLKNKNNIDYSFCIKEAKVNPSKESILNCIKQSGVNYFIDNENAKRYLYKWPEQNNFYYKALIIETFLENSEMIYEKYFEISDENVKIYKLN